MAFGRRDEAEPTSAGAPPSASGGAGGLTAFIDQGSSFEGKLSFKDTVRIDGHFTGEISSENTLVIGESGEIQADVKSETVIISGLLHGDITAGRKVVLHKTAQVEGNVKTPSIVIEDGAVFNGSLDMKSGNDKSKAPLKAVDPPSSPSS